MLVCSEYSLIVAYCQDSERTDKDNVAKAYLAMDDNPKENPQTDNKSPDIFADDSKTSEKPNLGGNQVIFHVIEKCCRK